MCQTIAGNKYHIPLESKTYSCDILTVTNFNNEGEMAGFKKGVVITSRVHPGETNASVIMEQIIEYLTGPSLESKLLRDNFIFKIVPMLNPDGVINGNYRCNLAGVDLNRVWIDPSKKLHPTIFNTKFVFIMITKLILKMIKTLKSERELLLFCDIHGHSRKKNIFMCNDFSLMTHK